jgi:HK97 family phage major capsid protein
VCPDWTGPRGEDPDDGSPPDRPYGTKPYGTKPYGTKPYGTKPYGTKPYGTKPYGTKPYGTKPYGTKPYGTKSDDSDFLDPDEWSEDVADLFCGCSAVVRLGARIVVDGGDLPIPAVEPVVGVADYVTQPRATNPAEDEEPRLKESQEKPRAGLSERHLRPKDHELAVKVVVPDDLVRTLVEDPEIAWALKQDLARALAFRADQAFLHGPGGDHDPPLGITNTAAVDPLPPGAPVEDLLKVVRRMVGELRRRERLVQWGNAGWILHPNTLDGLSRLLTQNTQNQNAPGWGVESALLLTHDGSDSGVFLGYPFIVSAATHDADADNGAGFTRIHFSSDWSEAWVGADRDLVTVSVSVDAHFQTDETVIRAVMYHDFVLRRPRYFIYADRPPGVEPVHLAGGADEDQNVPEPTVGAESDTTLSAIRSRTEATTKSRGGGAARSRGR